MCWTKTHTSVLALVKGDRERGRIAPCTPSPPLDAQPTSEGTAFPGCERSCQFPVDTQHNTAADSNDDDAAGEGEAGDADDDNDGDNGEDAMLMVIMMVKGRG